LGLAYILQNTDKKLLEVGGDRRSHTNFGDDVTVTS